MSQNNTSPLLDGIMAHARSQADRILEQARTEAAKLEETYLEKMRSSEELENHACEVQIAEILRREESSIKNASRRAILEQQDRVWNRLLERVQSRMESMVDEPAYRDVLIEWIAEAAIGLDRPKAVVACSFKEHIDRQMLDEATAMVAQTVGKQVALELSSESLSSQGIEVRSIDGTVAFNNQVVTRILRNARQLRELMEGTACKRE